MGCTVEEFGFGVTRGTAKQTPVLTDYWDEQIIEGATSWKLS